MDEASHTCFFRRDINANRIQQVADALFTIIFQKNLLNG